MNTLTKQYLNSLYDVVLDYSENLILVRNRVDGLLYIKKYIDPAVEDIYKSLANDPIDGIPRIAEVAYDGRNCYVIYEYVIGMSIKEYIQQNGALDSYAVAAVYIPDLCRILEKLHERNIIHRDITPANVIIAADGRCCFMIDFGIARTVKDNQLSDTKILGTAGFAPPEQFGFRQTDARADIYSLGVLLNYMLTGAMPNSKLAPAPFDKIVEICTALDPKNRYADVSQLKNELAQLCDTKKKSIIHRKKHNINSVRRMGSYITGTILALIFALLIPDLFNTQMPTEDKISTFVALFMVFFIPTAVIFDYFGLIRRISEKHSWGLAARIGIRIVVIILDLSIYSSIWDSIQ